MDWGGIIIAILGAIGLDRLVVYLLERKAKARQAEAAAEKAEAEADVTKAEVESKTLDNAFKWIDKLNAQIKDQECRLDKYNSKMSQLEYKLLRYAQRIEYLMNGIKVLTGQLQKNCIPLDFEPDEWSADDDGK